MQCHPDKNPGIDSAIMARLNEANRVLSDPGERKAYDQELEITKPAVDAKLEADRLEKEERERDKAELEREEAEKLKQERRDAEKEAEMASMRSKNLVS